MFGLFSKTSDKARIEKLEAEIDRLNQEPPSPERRAALEQAHYDLSRRDPAVGKASFDGAGRLTYGRFLGEATPAPKPRPSCPREARIVDLQEQIAKAELRTATPLAMVRVASMQAEIASLRAELAAERESTLVAKFESLREPARAAAAKYRGLVAKMDNAMAALLPLELEIRAAADTCRRLTMQAEDLSLSTPSLRGRRVESPVSADGLVGSQLVNAAQRAHRLEHERKVGAR